MAPRRKIVPPGEAPRVIDQGSVWILVAAPSIWAAHFLLSYWVAAIWCGSLAAWLAFAYGLRWVMQQVGIAG